MSLRFCRKEHGRRRVRRRPFGQLPCMKPERLSGVRRWRGIGVWVALQFVRPENIERPFHKVPSGHLHVPAASVFTSKLSGANGRDKMAAGTATVRIAGVTQIHQICGSAGATTAHHKSKDGVKVFHHALLGRYLIKCGHG